MSTDTQETHAGLAYFTNQYPSVSHTFIRREIHGLEARGWQVARFAVRSGGPVVDPADQEEAGKTCHLLAQPRLTLAAQALRTLLGNPGKTLRATRAALAMARRSDRGLLRHLAYLVEAAALHHLLDRAGVRHLHVHFGTNAAAVARLTRLLGGASYSMTIHGPDELDAPVGLSLPEKMLDAAFTIAISDYCASQLRRWLPYTEWAKLKVVHCTVAPEWFESESIPDSARDLVCVGRLAPQKGQLLLLDAFAEARARGAEGRLTLVGDGEMRGVLEQRIAELGIQADVTITGWQSEAEVRKHLLGARALVLASFAEGLPVVLMEAMALRRPVITTRITGTPELVRDGVDGWLVTPGNIPQLAGAIIEALNTPAERLNAMGAAAAERVHARHGVEGQVALLSELFQGILRSPAEA